MKRFYKRFLALVFALVMAMPFTFVKAESVNHEQQNNSTGPSALSAESTSSAITPTLASVDMSNGGWAMITAKQNVWSANSTSSTVIGTVYPGEGVTVLSQLGANLYVDYSTPNGNKQGYIIGPYIIWNFLDITRVGRVNSNTNVYYGPNTSQYQVAGTVYTGEYVSVLGLESGWFYIEYNTNSGRKRGYLPYSTVTTYGSDPLDDFYSSNSDLSVTTYLNVYAGPNTQYPVIGSVSNETVKQGIHFVLYGDSLYIYIEYNVTGTSLKKSGYIKIN